MTLSPRWRSGAIIAISLLIFSGGLRAGDWPGFQGPSRDGTSKETGLRRSFPDAGPEVLWTVELGPGFGGAAVAGGEVFLFDRILSEQDVLRCLDLKTGQELWRYAYEAPGRLNYAGSRGVPAVTEDRIYNIGGFGQVCCVDRETHQLVWSVDLREEYDTDPPRWGYAQSPLVFEDLLLVTPLGDDHGVVALDRETGEEVWRSRGLGTSHSTPALLQLNGVLQLLMVTAGRTTSFDPRTGRELWNTRALECSIPIPAPVRIDDERVFLTGGYGAGSALIDMQGSGDELKPYTAWKIARGSQVHPPLLIGKHLYLMANENDNHSPRKRSEGGLLCLDLEGQEQWRTGDSPYFGRGSMIYADGMLIIQDGFNGVLRLVEPSPEGFRPLAEANLFGITDTKDHELWGPLALSEGRLLMRGKEQLKCVDLSEPK